MIEWVKQKNMEWRKPLKDAAKLVAVFTLVCPGSMVMAALLLHGLMHGHA